jgi:DNA-binding MarR family transcriptional regulator
MENKGAIEARDLVAQLRRVDFLLHHKFWHLLKLKERPAGYMLLAKLRRATEKGMEGLRVSELALSTGITASGITQVVTALEERGMVGRKMDPEDRRAVRVYLTEKGRRSTDEMMAALESVFDDLVNYLGQEKSRVFLEILNDVIEYFNRQDTHDCPESDEKTAQQ